MDGLMGEFLRDVYAMIWGNGGMYDAGQETRPFQSMEDSGISGDSHQDLAVGARTLRCRKW